MAESSPSVFLQIDGCVLLYCNRVMQAGDLFVSLFSVSYLAGSFLVSVHNLVIV